MKNAQVQNLVQILLSREKYLCVRGAGDDRFERSINSFCLLCSDDVVYMTTSWASPEPLCDVQSPSGHKYLYEILVPHPLERVLLKEYPEGGVDL